MTVVFLVRHAAHDDVGRFLAGRKPGIRLGEAGRAQAGRLAARLVRERLDLVQASPRERTVETAGAIARASGLPDPEIVDALDEIDFGRWSGLTFPELNEDPAFRHWNEARATARTPAGEGMADVQARVVGHVETLVRERGGAGRRFALVTHADVVKAAVCHVLALPLDAWWRFDVEPASITTLAATDGGFRLLGLDEVIW